MYIDLNVVLTLNLWLSVALFATAKGLAMGQNGPLADIRRRLPTNKSVWASCGRSRPDGLLHYGYL